jgi:hypothetical protein
MIYIGIKQQVLIHIWQNRKSFQHTSNYAEQLIMMYSICYKIFDSGFVCVFYQYVLFIVIPAMLVDW